MTEVVDLATGRRGGNGGGGGGGGGQAAPAGDGDPGDLPAGVWPTPTALAMVAVAEACCEAGQIGMVTGPSGVGKTTGARAAVAVAHAAEHDATYVALTRATDGIQPGLARIAVAVGAAERGTNLSAGALHDAVVSRFRGFGRGRLRDAALVVVDEAQYASDTLLHALRDVWDDLDGHESALGLVLVGTSDLSDRVNGRGAKARGFAPLRGRLGTAVELPAPDADDAAAVARHLGLAGRQETEIIARAARASGGLHNVRRLLAQARMLAREGEPVGPGHLRRAADVKGIAA